MGNTSDKKFDTPDLLQIFPTFVWKANLKPEEFQPLNRSLLQSVAGTGAPLTGLRPGENWQSDHGLHELEQFREFADWVVAAAGNVLDYLRILHQGVAITGCWANVNPPGTGHRLHSHRNNYLSGVYYVQTQEGADTINFFDPRPQAGVIRPPVSEHTAENTELAVVRVTDGTLLLFPAWLQHSVNTNRSQKTRVSMSFNLMFSGFTELMARPGWTPGRGVGG